jgi:hypothetical protein
MATLTVVTVTAFEVFTLLEIHIMVLCGYYVSFSKEHTVSVIRVGAELECATNTRSYTVLAKTTMM